MKLDIRLDDLFHVAVFDMTADDDEKPLQMFEFILCNVLGSKSIR